MSRCRVQKTTESERIIRLWGAIARACPHQLGQHQLKLFEDILRTLGEYSSDDSKTVRYRACQLLHQVINNLQTDELPMSDDAMDTLQDQLVQRLDDKIAAVRAVAAQALKRFPQADEV